MEGLAVKGSRFTYAIGRIVLYSIDRELVVGPETLHHRKFAKLAIAEPALAPYGAAAMQVLRALSRIDSVEHRIVKGLNISQTFQFIHSGNAELGFVALSQVALHARGSRWIVPRDLHAPIAQDAVLLRPGTGNDAAKAFLAFLRGADTDAIRRKYGYNRDN